MRSGIKTARELGKYGTAKFIYLPCEKCGKPRWVGISQAGVIRSHFCRSCGCHLGRLRGSIAEKNKDGIVYEYTVNKRSASAIAKEFSLSISTITSKLKSCGVEIRPPKTRTKEEKKLRIRQWMNDNPEKKREYSITSNRRLKREVLSRYSEDSTQCVTCGIDDIDVLCLDHINGGGEAHRRTIPGKGQGLHLY